MVHIMKYTAYSAVFVKYVIPRKDDSDVYGKLYDFEMANKIYPLQGTNYQGPVTKDYKVELPLRTVRSGYYHPEDAEKLIAFLKELGVTEDEEGSEDS